MKCSWGKESGDPNNIPTNGQVLKIILIANLPIDAYLGDCMIIKIFLLIPNKKIEKGFNMPNFVTENGSKSGFIIEV